MATRHGRRHRKRSRGATKIAAIGAATATATALTICASPLPNPAERDKALVDTDVRLAAAVNQWPDPNEIPDLTLGLGPAVYDLGQAAAEVLIRLVVENFNLAVLAQAAGADPETVLNNLLGGVLGEIPPGLLGDVIGAVPIDVPGVIGALLEPLEILGTEVGDDLSEALAGSLPETLGGLLDLLGLDLSDPFNLSNLPGPVNVITAGPVFTVLKLLGVDLGWVPGLPNAIAEEVNKTPYLDAEVRLGDVLDELGILNPILELIGVSIPNLDVVEVRVPVVLGMGLGAFSAGAAYERIVADLVNQPGGENSDEHPLLGSITILPLILLRNPGRANGGMFARFYPLFGLAGINTVTPETEITHSGGISLLDTGLSIGGANLIPLKLDATVEYDFMSDFAAWPNPFSLANNLFAGLLPTYMLRGLTLDTEQLAQLTGLAERIKDGDPVAVNLYLTLRSATLPLLEPFYLAADVLNLVTLGTIARYNPFSLVANALAPALTSLVNLGYTDVVYDPVTGGYTRTLTEAGDPTPFMSFPNVDWAQVPGVIFNQLVQGIYKEFFSGNPTVGTPNVLTNLLRFLTGGSLWGTTPVSVLTDVVNEALEEATEDVVPGTEDSDLPSPTDLLNTDANSRMLTLSTDEQKSDEEPTDEIKLDQNEQKDVVEQVVEKLENTDADPGEQQLVTEKVVVENVKVDEAKDGETNADGLETTDTKPVETKPVETKPETKPTDTKPSETKPSETKPARTGTTRGNDDGDTSTSKRGYKPGNKFSPNTGARSGPRHAKPDNGEPVRAIPGSSPRHAKPDNDPPSATAGDTDTNSAGAGSDSAAA
nr:ATPase [Mycolicibacterium malmesburyense]CRL78928.1 ATPase [Mycolicibacterium malmesburyense]